MPIGASIVAAGAGIGKAVLGAQGESAANKAAQQASAQNIAFENQVYGTAQNNLNPSIGYGNEAGGELAGLLGIGGNAIASQNAFQNYLGSTNYNFVLGQGENAVKTANAPAYASSATDKALNNYAQGQAGSTLAGYEQLLGGEQGLGVQAGLGLAGVGTNIAGQEASARNNAASVAGQTANATAAMYGNALSGVAGSIGGLSSSSFGGFGGFGGGSALGNAGGQTPGNSALSGYASGDPVMGGGFGIPGF